MGAHFQSVFLIENLQPSWLPRSNCKWVGVYTAGSRLLAVLSAMVFGVLTLRVSEKIGRLVYPAESLNAQPPVEYMGVTGGLWRWLIVTVFCGGITMAVLDFSRLGDVPSWKKLTKSKALHLLIDMMLYLRNNVLLVNVILFFIVFFFAAAILQLNWETSAKGALTYAVQFGLVTWFRGRGQNIGNDIRTADRLGWSRRSIPNGLGWGWVGGFLIGLVVTLTGLRDRFVVAIALVSIAGFIISFLGTIFSTPTNTRAKLRVQPALVGAAVVGTLAMIVVLLVWGTTLGLKIAGLFGAMGMLVGLIIKGLKKVSIIEKTSPNQGIKSSFRNTIVLWLLVGVCSVSLIWLYVLLFVGLRELDQVIGSPKAVLEAALFFGLVIGLIFGFAYGGFDVVNHFTLRLLLVRLGLAPLNYGAFLDKAVRLRFLREIGGGYTYLHELIRKELERQSSPVSRSIGRPVDSYSPPNQSQYEPGI